MRNAVQVEPGHPGDPYHNHESNQLLRIASTQSTYATASPALQGARNVTTAPTPWLNQMPSRQDTKNATAKAFGNALIQRKPGSFVARGKRANNRDWGLSPPNLKPPSVHG